MFREVTLPCSATPYYKNHKIQNNLHGVNVEVDVGLAIKNFRVLCDEVLNKFRKQKVALGVLGADLPNFLNEAFVLLLLLRQVALGLLEAHLVVGDALIQILK